MDNDVVVVGIGASAGGLEALQSLVKNLPDNTNMTYIIAQHLSPTYKSMMVDLLNKESQLPVLEAKDGLELQRDHIYICPPNKDITIKNNSIVLSAPNGRLYGPKPSVDIFFESLAMEKGDHAVGIILSGTGSDGARGVRAIKAEGGYVLAQEPKSAKYDGMPVSAINTGNIDLILPADQIGTELIELLNYPAQKIDPESNTLFTNLYTNMLSKLYDLKGVDFTAYKPSTIQRRIERRMAALKLINLTDYHNYLSHNSEEAEALFKDILIGVTSFFRDKEAFDALEKNIEELLSHKEDNAIRIWAPGSSTGEEAYSIAIMLSIILGEKISKYKIQIFATDIDEDALAFARKGTYPESALIEVDKKIRNRYFLAKSEHYEVVKPIREMVIFSRHDIIKDPPFLRLDAVICRNLLIYFSQDLQKKLFPTFHYSINDHGLLFLGKSESVGHFSNYFKTIDKKWKIYKANFIGRKEPPSSINLQAARQLEQKDRITPLSKPTLQEKLFEFVNEKIVSMCIIVNDNMDIVFVKGKNPYLIQPEGERTNNVFRNILPTLNVELRSILHESSKEHKVTKSRFQKVVLLDDVIRYVRMTVMPMENNDDSILYMICFQEEDSEQFKSFDVGIAYDDSEATKRLELELARTKEHLQTVIEELETSNEEMQSLNEELQSSNEELQSSNEELETTNEELQSTNEELQTAYTELRVLYDEKADSNKILEELKLELEFNNKRLQLSLDAAGIGIFDKSIPASKDDYWSEEWCNILGFTSGELPSDSSMIPEWVNMRIHPDDLVEYEDSLESLISGVTNKMRHKFRIKHKSDKWIWIENYLIAVSRNEKNEAKQIIGIYKDITEEHTRIKSLEKSNIFLEQIQEIGKIAIWEWNIDKDEILWSDKMYEIFDIPKNTDITYNMFLDKIDEKDLDKVKNAVDKSLNTNSEYSITYRLKHAKQIKAKAQIIVDEHDKVTKLIGIVEDITEEIMQKEKNLVMQHRIEGLVSNTLNGVYIFDFVQNRNTFINQQYTNITGYTLEELNNMDSETFLSLFHPDEVNKVFKHMDQVKSLKSGESSTLHYRFKHKNGYWIKCYSNDILLEVSEDGTPLKMLGSFVDITEIDNHK